jgi:processive 1,2-diacylglycerol beta-glucosyltransferase
MPKSLITACLRVACRNVPRVLIFSASIGEGHDLPARELAAALEQRGAQASIADTLKTMGPVVERIITTGARGPLFDLSYLLVVKVAATRRAQERLGMALGGRGLRRLIAERAPDVIVSTYPGINPLLARMDLGIPLVSAITDLTALEPWVHPDFALHLITQAESVAEVRRLGGRATRVAHVRGLTRPEFEQPVDRADARRELGLPAADRIVVVSGGGWAVGDLEGAALAAVEAGARAVALCGRDEALRARLGAIEGVQAWGFTDRMGDLLAAADVLVHSTAGLTVYEAQVRGTRVISYGWGAGHVRVNNRAFAELDMAGVARTPAELRAALRRALERPRTADRSYERLPHAADEILKLARPATPAPATTTDGAGRSPASGRRPARTA